MIPSSFLLPYLDELGLGSGQVETELIGDGHSNLTYLLGHGGERFVLRRPPSGTISRFANDVVREARIFSASPRRRFRFRRFSPSARTKQSSAHLSPLPAS